MSENGNAIGFWRGAAQEVKKLRSLAGAGVLSAAGVVLKFLTLPVGDFLKIGFAFLATALTGYLYGPLVAGMSAVVVDLLGYLVKPTGAYFAGFTLSAFVNGLIYGCWLWKRQVKLWRVLCACATSTLLVSFVLNPLWLHMLYGEAFMGILAARVATNLVLLPINTAMLYMLLKVVEVQKARLVKQQ